MTDTANPEVRTNPEKETESSYRSPHPGKVKRLWLASLLGALSAVLLVALCALVIGVFVSLVGNVLNATNGSVFENGLSNGSPFLMGMAGAFFAALFNWYFFWITIPVTTLVLRLSLGRFPKRQISRPGPYFRWGAIWGALLVIPPSLFAGYMVAGTSFDTVSETPAESFRAVQSLLGATLAGGMIGAASGIGVGGLFLLIVKPAKQLMMADPAAEF